MKTRQQNPCRAPTYYQQRITVFKVAWDPLLTLGHEFAHLVEDLKSVNIGKHLASRDDEREKKFDDPAMRDLSQFQVQKQLGESKPQQ